MPVAARFQDMRLGLFVHYVFNGRPYVYGTLGRRADGTVAASLDEYADGLDADDLADVAASMHAEYLIFTAWHANMNVLYPSPVMQRYLPGHTARRDVVADLVAALGRRGIRLLLYCHPSDGHDFSPEDQARVGWHDGFPYARWNEFINAVYAEMFARYRGQVLGYYVDGGLPPQVNFTIERLRETMRRADPDALVIQNNGFHSRFRTWADLGSRETIQPPYRVDRQHTAMVVTTTWWADNGYAMFPPELAFQYTVLQAGVHGHEGGGMAWSAGPYPGGCWELGVREFFATLGRYIEPVQRGLVGTQPSRAFLTMEGTALLNDPLWVATEAGDQTFVHVLRPPADRTLYLPVPADRRTFSRAFLLAEGRPAELVQDEAGVRVTLPDGARWETLDTAFVLA
jgi:hypothetical protein